MPHAATRSRAQAELETAGWHGLSEPVDPVAAARLLAEIRATRTFDGGLFLSEAEFLADPQYTGVNPRPGRNLLDTLDAAFLEAAPELTATLREMLGDGYVMLNRKIVCGVPDSALPAWVKSLIAGNPVNNLGAFVRPEFRDITYFYGIDFHQDLIDFKDRDADFLTVYGYLHEVTRADAPLFVLEGSHALGGTLFPHDLERTGPEAWTYGDRNGQRIDVVQKVLTGGAGFTAMWHACTLHGTQPDMADHERISLRYLFARDPAAKSVGLDAVNARLRGPLRLAGTRTDLDERGAAMLKQNAVNRAG